MIAIEYDGYLHKNQKKRDKEKDRLCKESGITIYRIREPHVPLLNDGISKEYQLQDAHYFCPSLREAISIISSDISLKYLLSIPKKASSFDLLLLDITLVPFSHELIVCLDTPI